MLKSMLFGKTIEKAKPWLVAISGDGIGYYTSDIRSVAVASDGSVYICGSFEQSSTGIYVGYIAKFNSSGILQWQKTLSNNTKNTNCNSITISSDGSIYVCGYVYGIFLIKLNSSGILQWQKTFYNITGISVDIAPDNSIYVYGYDGTALFLLKFNSSGISQWNNRLSGVKYTDDGSHPLAIAPDGSIYICGHLEPSIYDDNLYIVKFDSSGDVQWQKVLGRSNNYYEKGQSVAVASDGSVYLCGWTNSAGAGSYDLYLAKFNSSGTIQWQKTLGDTSGDEGHSVTVAPDDSVYVCGQTRNDVLIAKFDSSGALQWQKMFDNNDYLDEGNPIAVAPDGSVYACGFSYAAYTTKEHKLFLAKITDSIIEKNTGTLGIFTFKDASLTVNNVSLLTASYSDESIYGFKLGEDISSNYPVTVATSSLTINLYNYEE